METQTQERDRLRLPRYQSHKVVEASRIVEVNQHATSPSLLLDVGVEWPVTPEWVGKHEPQPGGYLVVYADGYESWSPAEAFEGGYTSIEMTSEDSAPEEDGPVSPSTMEAYIRSWIEVVVPPSMAQSIAITKLEELIDALKREYSPKDVV